MIPVTVTEVKSGSVDESPRVEHHRLHRRRLQDVLAERHRQAGCQDHAGGPAGPDSDFRENDKITATIITTKPPRVLTDKEVKATLATNTPPAWLVLRPRPVRRQRRRQRRRGRGAAGRGRDVGRCAEGVAQDRQPTAGSRSRGSCVAPCGFGSHGRAASRDALAGTPITAGPRSLPDGARPAPCPARALFQDNAAVTHTVISIPVTNTSVNPARSTATAVFVGGWALSSSGCSGQLR